MSADGTIDALEKQNLVEAMRVAFSEDNLSICESYMEINFLLTCDKVFQEKALECIKDELVEHPQYKLMILELMISTAHSSEDISEIEKKKIEELKDILNIE